MGRLALASTTEFAMMELVFVACLLSAPDRCEERSLQYVDVPSVMTCVMGAQPQLAEWAEAHPNWRVARWKCRTPGYQERSI